MNTPQFSPKHNTYNYWIDVSNGKIPPDEYQQALMNIVQQGLDAGIFYESDMRAYVKEHADFIPADAWNIQFERRPVEGGVVGFECYFARDAIRKAEIRAENAAATAALPIGLNVGTLCVNGKKYTGMTVDHYDGGTIYLIGKAGKYQITIWTEPSKIETMKQRAIERGWRKS